MGRQNNSVSWLFVAAPTLFGPLINETSDWKSLGDETLILELNIMRSQPQPNWTQLLKVIIISLMIIKFENQIVMFYVLHIGWGD